MENNKLPILVINLPQRKERWNSCLNEIDKINEIINKIYKIKAFDYNYAEVHKYNYITKKAYYNIVDTKTNEILSTWGSVACAISHIFCWKYIIEKNLDYALICEDDIKIESDELCFDIMEMLFHCKKNKNNNLVFFDSKINNVCNSNVIYNNTTINNMSGYSNFEYNNSTNINSTINNTNSMIYNIHNNNTNNTNNTTNNTTYNSTNNTSFYYNDNHTNSNIINLEKVNNKKIKKTHLYLINKDTAKILLNNILPLTYPFNIQISKILSKNFLLNINALNKITNLSAQYNFLSDVKYFKPNLKFIKNLFKNTFDTYGSICELIYKKLDYNFLYN